MKNLEYYEVRLPASLDLEKLIKEDIPSVTTYANNAKKITERAVYILGQIYASWRKAKNRKLPNSRYTSLSAVSLSSVVRNYKEYLGYFIEKGVIETDNHYRTEGMPKCKCYAFTEKYFDPEEWKTYKIKERRLLRSIQKEILRVNEQKSKEAKNKYGYLNKWLESKQLTIEIEVATREILEAMEGRSEEDIHKELEKVRSFDTYGNTTFCKATTGRLFTSITSFKKEARRALRYKGEKFLEVDIKNAIPSLSTVLLDIETVAGNIQVMKMLQKSNPKIFPSCKDVLNLYKGVFEAYYKLNIEDYIEAKYTNDEKHTYMFSKLLRKWEEIHDVRDYIRYVSSGLIYEHLVDPMQEALEKTFNRGKVKLLLLKVFNSPATGYSGAY